MENFEWRYEQRQWDWDNPFLPVKAHLRLSVWGGCPGCNCGDPASVGLVLSFQADQIIPSWTAWGPEVTFPIGRKALQGGTKPLVSQESMSLNITSFYCGGKISVVSVPHSIACWRGRGSSFKSFCHSLWNTAGLKGPEDFPGCDFKA